MFNRVLETFLKVMFDIRAYEANKNWISSDNWMSYFQSSCKSCWRSITSKYQTGKPVQNFKSVRNTLIWLSRLFVAINVVVVSVSIQLKPWLGFFSEKQSLLSHFYFFVLNDRSVNCWCNLTNVNESKNPPTKKKHFVH